VPCSTASPRRGCRRLRRLTTPRGVRITERLVSEAPIPGGREPRLPPQFRLLWSAQVTSSLGDGVMQVGLPLYAAAVGHGALAVATVAALQRVPWLVLGLPAGLLADRQPSWRILVVVWGLLGLAVSALGVLAALGRLGLGGLDGLALLLGTGAVLAYPPVPILLRDTTPRDLLPRANSRLSAATTVGEEAAGPAVGGLLFALFRAVPLLADGASFLAAAGIGLGLAPSQAGRARAVAHPEPGAASERGGPGRETPTQTATGPAGGAGLLADLAAGARWLLWDRPTRTLVGTTAVFAFCQSLVTGIFVLYGLHDLRLAAAAYGVFIAITAVGDVAGGLVGDRIIGRLGTSATILAGGAVAAVAYLGLAAEPNRYVAAPLLALEAVGIVAGSAASGTFRQRLVPRPLLGRVNGAIRTVLWGIIPIGSVVGGALAIHIGLRATIGVAGAAQLVALAALAGPLRRAIAGAEGVGPGDRS